MLEALVALTLVLAFAAALGPYLFHARRIMVDAEGRVAAQVAVEISSYFFAFTQPATTAPDVLEIRDDVRSVRQK